MSDIRQLAANLQAGFVKKHYRLICVGIFFLSTGGFVLIEWMTVPRPQERHIHVQHFRYGTDPAIIRSSRGDDLYLTFSTEDTGHSFFLQDYGIDVKVSPSKDTVLVYNPFKVTEPPLIADSIHLVAGKPGFLGRLISVSRFRCHVYCGPMHGFEQGDLIVRPNWLFSISMGVTIALFLSWLIRCRWDNSYTHSAFRRIDLNRKSKLLDRLSKWRPLPFLLTLPVLTVFVILILAGILGTKVGGRNIAVMLTWACWMPLLTLFLVPVGGRIWCLICPLPVLGEYVQRGATIQVRTNKGTPDQNRYFSLGFQWPETLKGPWIKMVILLCLGSFSASLAGQPRWTAIVLASLMLLALICAMIWKGRSFCSYICPVSSFLSLYSPVGRLMVRSRKTAVCRKCAEKSCYNGNEKGWGCPYGLLVQEIDRNSDCGICLECFKSCPYDNVSLSWRKGAWKDCFRSYGEAWQAIVLLSLAIAYSFTIHSPWPGVRDIVNMVDKVNWIHFSCFLIGLWLFCLVIMPLLFWILNYWGIRWSKFPISSGIALRKTAPSAIPLGLGLWAAFFIAMFMPNIAYIVMTLSDPFGWGWDLLGTSGKPWIQLWPGAIPWVQVFLVSFGFYFSLRKGYTIWHEEIQDRKQALKMFFPASLLIFTVSLGMLIYFTHY